MELVTNCDRFKTLKHSSVPMRAFTEHGIIMLASVLKSDVAALMSVRITRAFVAMRRALASLAPILARIETNERRQIADQAKNDANQAHNEERFRLILDAMQDKKFPPQKRENECCQCENIANSQFQFSMGAFSHSFRKFDYCQEKERRLKWQLATLKLATLPYWQHSTTTSGRSASRSRRSTSRTSPTSKDSK